MSYNKQILVARIREAEEDAAELRREIASQNPEARYAATLPLDDQETSVSPEADMLCSLQEKIERWRTDLAFFELYDRHLTKITENDNLTSFWWYLRSTLEGGDERRRDDNRMCQALILAWKTADKLIAEAFITLIRDCNRYPAANAYFGSAIR